MVRSLDNHHKGRGKTPPLHLEIGGLRDLEIGGLGDLEIGGLVRGVGCRGRGTLVA